jgi:DNA-binding MarR family transcriptional regulator
MDDPESRISYVLWQTHHASERLLSEALQPLGVTLALFGILKHLKCAPKLTGAELARRLDVTPQSVSSAIGQARALGWITSESHAHHRSLVELELTRKGAQMLHGAVARVCAIEARITADLTAREQGTLSKLLKRVRRQARGF